jgi:hypothetical protein
MHLDEFFMELICRKKGLKSGKKALFLQTKGVFLETIEGRGKGIGFSEGFFIKIFIDMSVDRLH